MGPLECLVVEFPGNKFSGEILPALRAVVDKDLVRIIDLTFVRKDASGNVAALELTDLGEDDMKMFDPITSDVTGLLSSEDVAKVAASLNDNSSAALLLLEHVWAVNVRDAIVRANGRLILDEHIPPAAVEAALATTTVEESAAPTEMAPAAQDTAAVAG